MRRTLPAALLLAARLSVAAPVVPGTRMASHDDMGQRRSIRGETLEARESAELAAMRRYEEEQLLPSLGTAAHAVGEAPERYASLALPDITVRWDARLIRFLDFYKGDRRGRAIMGSWLRAQGRYRAMIEEALARHHLPHALLYIAMIESGYDPLDRSFAGASGLWQFMPEGARIYGLRVDHWIDERNDPEKATEAQMRYFDDLHTRFGSWHLALAAFNAGYGAALNAVAKYNSNDYWEICRHEDGLPWETVLYVPKFVAAAIVGENRALFGYEETGAEPAWRYDAVPVGASVTLEEAARLAGVTTTQVEALNPELRQGRTPPGMPWAIKLPVGSGSRFLAHAAAFEKSREALVTYAVRLGDRIESIAKSHHTSPARLRKWNGIRDASEVRPGLVLLVPPASKGGAQDRADEGRTLIAVADKDARVEGQRRLFYRVAPGDGLVELARRFGVSEEELARWNRLDPEARLTSGLILQAWVAPDLDLGADAAAVMEAKPDPATDPVRVVTAGSEEFLDLVEARRGRKRVVVTVRAGDTMKRVGQHYGLTEGDMERINQMGRGTQLKPGDTLVVYLPMSAAERAEATRRLEAGAQAPPVEDAEPGEQKAAIEDAPAAAWPKPIEDPGVGAEAANAEPAHPERASAGAPMGLHMRRLPELPPTQE